MASEEFLEHDSKDVKLLVACILADVFRIFAPEHPFGNTQKLKVRPYFLLCQHKNYCTSSKICIA